MQVRGGSSGTGAEIKLDSGKVLTVTSTKPQGLSPLRELQRL